MPFPRSSGILLHPSSFPSRFGIGDLGLEAYRFVDFLAQSYQQLWQILPVGPTGYGYSPYASYSASEYRMGVKIHVQQNHRIESARLAQRRLAQLAVPLMPVGGRIVYVTSHQAHFFPNKAVPKGYVAVAASKRAGETALYGMRSVLAHAGVYLTVVSGDRIDGPNTAPLPTADEFAEAIVGATRTPLPPSIVYVGKADCLMSA